MTEGQLKVWLQQYIDDLKTKEIADIIEACARYRRDGKNKSMASPGALLAIIRDISPPPEKPGWKEERGELIPAKRVEKVIADARAKYPSVFKGEKKNQTKLSPSKTMKEISSGRLWDSTKSRTAYVPSPPELVEKAKALVRRVKAQDAERDERERQ